MLYVDSIGTPWLGLTEVSMDPANGGMEPRYLDGQLVNLYATLPDNTGKISAFTYPDAFEECIGTRSSNGLRLHHQPTKAFDLVYRRMLGAADGTEGYEIIFMYQCRTVESSSSDVTDSDAIELKAFSWDFVSKPVSIPGFRPTAYLTLRTRDTTPTKIASIERVIYGVTGVPARMPTVAELMAYLAS